MLFFYPSSFILHPFFLSLLSFLSFYGRVERSGGKTLMMDRPDLSRTAPEIVEYIQFLETEINHLQAKTGGMRMPVEAPPAEPDEAPTTINVITATRTGSAKRTARHEYGRQRRGGMGVFDLETPEKDPPAILCAADEPQTLLLLTDRGRGFRLPVTKILSSPVRAKGESMIDRLPFEPGEAVAAILPTQASGYLALVTKNGMVRCLRHHLFGDYLKPGTAFLNGAEFGPLAAACWTPGDTDLLIATRQGLAIRFAEKLVPPQGTRGIRVENGDEAVAVTPVDDESGVFLIGEDGKGTIRLMTGFNPNKSPGGGGKLALKTDGLVGAFCITPGEDILIISKLGKIIRFEASEVPTTEGVIQGVICMSLRADTCVAALKTAHGEPA
jgi:DNA gyrase subunit A